MAGELCDIEQQALLLQPKKLKPKKLQPKKPQPTAKLWLCDSVGRYHASLQAATVENSSQVVASGNETARHTPSAAGTPGSSREGREGGETSPPPQHMPLESTSSEAPSQKGSEWRSHILATLTADEQAAIFSSLSPGAQAAMRVALSACEEVTEDIQPVIALPLVEDEKWLTQHKLKWRKQAALNTLRDETLQAAFTHLALGTSFSPTTQFEYDELNLEDWKSTRTKTGFKGVRARGKRFEAQMTMPRRRGKRRTLVIGVFETVEEAATAFAKAYMKMHGHIPIADAEVGRSILHGSKMTVKEPARQYEKPPPSRSTRTNRERLLNELTEYNSQGILYSV